MNINTISYLVADAFRTMKKDIKNELISLGTMLATMVLIATAYIVYTNANVVINNTKDEQSNLLAYLEVGLSENETERIGDEIKNITGVTDIKFRSVEESIQKAEDISKILVEGFTREQLEEIYQPCYIITFDNVEAISIIASELREIEGVGSTKEDIRVNPYALEAQRDAKISKVISVTAMILIIEFSVFLMINTTKLMMYAKRREISIMKYVGARNFFIKAPFAIQGVITALISVAVTMMIAAFVYPLIVDSMNKLGGGATYLEYAELSSGLAQLLLIIGCIIGIGGSTASMNKYLDV